MRGAAGVGWLCCCCVRSENNFLFEISAVGLHKLNRDVCFLFFYYTCVHTQKPTTEQKIGDHGAPEVETDPGRSASLWNYPMDNLFKIRF